MSDSVRLSIILPAYNHEQYIGKALESILEQSFNDFEVIVIDDGSNDSTWSIIEQYSKKDHRIKASRQENMGASKTQEIALSRAIGEWVTFCGSDDSFPEGAFEALMKNTDGKDLVIGAHYCVDDYGACQKVRLSKSKSLIKQLYFTGAVWGKAFRIKFLSDNKIGFPDLLLEEDTVFLSQLAAAKPRWVLTDKAVYNYWEHNLSGISLSRNVTSELFAHRVIGKETVLKNLKSAGYIAESEYYFDVFSEQLCSQLPLMQCMEGAEYCFSLFKNFVLQRDWHGKETLFTSMFHYEYSAFKNVDYQQYCSRLLRTPPKDYVLDMFKSGRLGCKYILKYFAAWAAYKIKRNY